VDGRIKSGHDDVLPFAPGDSRKRGPKLSQGVTVLARPAVGRREASASRARTRSRASSSAAYGWCAYRGSASLRFCRQVNAFVTFLCSTRAPRRAARTGLLNLCSVILRRSRNRPSNDAARSVRAVVLGGSPRLNRGSHLRMTETIAGRDDRAGARYARSRKGIWPCREPGNCQNPPLVRFNFASTLESNPGPIALGRHEMRDFMRVSLATGASPLAPGGWDRGV
jgi:hypothetical protein